MKEVALITLHGSGKVKPSYYSKLEEMLKSRLKEKWTRVSFQNVQYAPILQTPQDELLASMVTENKLDGFWLWLRKRVLFGFGDAVSLEHSAQKDKREYIAVQREIQKALDHALLDFDGDTKRPVVVIAQSLGGQVISNYLWDAQHGTNIFSEPSPDPQHAEFLALKSLTNLVTTGCNIPIFNSGLKDRICFAKPNDSFAWDNFFDPDDVLGYPLKQLGPTYNEIVQDHRINAGYIYRSCNPFSHGGYWSDKDVVSPLADILLSKMS